jgi:hypothetical protein
VFGHVNNVVYYLTSTTVVNQVPARRGRGSTIERGAVIGLVVEDPVHLFQPDGHSRTRCTPGFEWLDLVRAAFAMRRSLPQTTILLRHAQGHYRPRLRGSIHPTPYRPAE